MMDEIARGLVSIEREGRAPKRILVRRAHSPGVVTTEDADVVISEHDAALIAAYADEDGIELTHLWGVPVVYDVVD